MTPEQYQMLMQYMQQQQPFPQQRPSYGPYGQAAGPYAQQSGDQYAQPTPLPYYDSGQNAGTQMQQLPYVEPQQQQQQQQPTDPLAAWMRQHQPQTKRNSAQQMQQRGLQLMSPQFPGGQRQQFPGGLAPLYWANPNQGY